MNRSLLEDTLCHIVGHPELHGQSFFYERNEFGVCACFAGRALLLAGYTPVLPNRLGSNSSMARHPKTGEIVDVWHEAKTVLDIPKIWAANLFTPVNNRLMLERKVKDLLNGSLMDTYYELVSERS